MHKNNLSAWALAHQNIVGYFFFLVLALGVFGYMHLGQAEDPPFTFKVMLVQVRWPGASAVEVEKQVVNRIEKVIMESPFVSDVRSFFAARFRHNYRDCSRQHAVQQYA